MTTKACKYYFKILKENTLICKNNLEKKIALGETYKNTGVWRNENYFMTNS